MTTFDEEIVDAEFEELGIDGFYGTQPCKLLRASDDDVGLDFGGVSRPVERQSVFLVRKSEVTPVEGGLFTVGSETFKVAAKPTFEDNARLKWRCRVSVQIA